MRSKDVVVIARQRAGLTQDQLATRTGYPRETIARWETGGREPSLARLDELVAACDLDLVVRLTKRDESLRELVAEQLALPVDERLRRLLPPDQSADALRALRWLASARIPTIVIGGVAAALQGAPQRPGGGSVEVAAGDPGALTAEMEEGGLEPVDSDERWAETDRRWPWTLPGGGTIVLASRLPGSRDYPDLRRSARLVELDSGESVQVAHPRDLLRLADASPRDTERARAPGLRSLVTKIEEP